MSPVVVVVVYSGDAPDDLSVVLCQRELDPSVLVERVPLRIELLAFRQEERWDPVRVVTVPLERVPDKALQVGAGFNGPDLQRHVALSDDVQAPTDSSEGLEQTL